MDKENKYLIALFIINILIPVIFVQIAGGFSVNLILMPALIGFCTFCGSVAVLHRWITVECVGFVTKDTVYKEED